VTAAAYVRESFDKSFGVVADGSHHPPNHRK
jgi:hypothetical protein